MIGRNNLTMEEIADLKSAILSNDEEKVREIISPNISAGDNKSVAVKKLLKDIDALPEGSPFFMKDFNVYMKNFPEVPVPKTVIQMYYSYDGEQERQAVINFWKLLVLNPNTRVRNELPKFLFNNGFHITSEGLIVSFRRAWDRTEQNMKLHEYVINEYSRRKLQKKKVNGLYVYEDQHGFFFINDQITDAKDVLFLIDNGITDTNRLSLFSRLISSNKNSLTIQEILSLNEFIDSPEFAGVNLNPNGELS